MKKLLKTVVLLAGILATTSCSAGAESVNTTKVKQAFQARFPNQQVKSVTATPISGVYEIVLGDRQIVYSDAKVDYLFVEANLLDVKKHKSLTEARMEAISKVDWNTLPLDLALKEVRGNGTRKLVVFSDPDCPFCHQLEKESLSQLDNVTIYTFLYPLAQLHPDAMHKSKQIWCSDNRVASWTGWMREGKVLTANDSCDTSALDKIQALGEQLGVTGTPTLVFASGRLAPGALPKEQIETYFAEKK